RLRIATQATTTTDPTALARQARNCDSTITEGWARVARHKEMAGMVFSTRFIKTKAIASILKKREGGVAGSMTKARQTTNPAASRSKTATAPDKARSSLPMPYS